MAYRNPKTGLGGGGIAEKLASEAYRATGGIAWNSIANRATAGHEAPQPKPSKPIPPQIVCQLVTFFI